MNRLDRDYVLTAINFNIDNIQEEIDRLLSKRETNNVTYFFGLIKRDTSKDYSMHIRLLKYELNNSTNFKAYILKCEGSLYITYTEYKKYLQ